MDKIYNLDDSESERISNALQVYGADKFEKEFKFCVNEIIQMCNSNGNEKLREILFAKKSNNSFQSIFAIIFIAFHELLIKENKKISDYQGIKDTLRNSSSRIEKGRSAAKEKERRKNINGVVGIIKPYFVPNDKNPRSFIGDTAPDIDASIRRSTIELSNYELKQGILTLNDPRKIDPNIISKLVNTIAAIANNGPDSSGGIIIGIADTDKDTQRIEMLDGIKSIPVGKRNVVGVDREARFLNITLEKYISLIKDGIKKSELTDSVKMSVLSALGYNNYYGLGIITINVPPQKEMAFVGNEVYWRSGDSTERASDPKRIATIARRF